MVNWLRQYIFTGYCDHVISFCLLKLDSLDDTGQCYKGKHEGCICSSFVRKVQTSTLFASGIGVWGVVVL